MNSYEVRDIVLILMLWCIASLFMCICALFYEYRPLTIICDTKYILWVGVR
jgi:hypothetical protein